MPGACVHLLAMRLSEAEAALLEDVAWSALNTAQAGLAEGGALARRFPADTIPFAGLARVDAEALRELRALLAPGESVFVQRDVPMDTLGARETGLTEIGRLPLLQMVLPDNVSLDDGRIAGDSARLVALDAEDVAEMMTLKAAAFPGYFGARAASLGSFFGIRVEGALVAMGGERMRLPGMVEISALCTHPAHAGRGYAEALLRRLVHNERERGLRPFLHVVSTNARAIALYRRLGFVDARLGALRHLQALSR